MKPVSYTHLDVYKRQVYKLVRLRMINQVPSEIDTSYLDAQKVPDLENYNLETRSLYEILRTQYRFQLTGGEENISITCLLYTSRCV